MELIPLVTSGNPSQVLTECAPKHRATEQIRTGVYFISGLACHHTQSNTKLTSSYTLLTKMHDYFSALVSLCISPCYFWPAPPHPRPSPTLPPSPCQPTCINSQFLPSKQTTGSSSSSSRSTHQEIATVSQNHTKVGCNHILFDRCS